MTLLSTLYVLCIFLFYVQAPRTSFVCRKKSRNEKHALIVVTSEQTKGQAQIGKGQRGPWHLLASFNRDAL